MAIAIARRHAQTAADTRSRTEKHASRKLSVGLWTVQGILALLFVMTASMKLFMPAEALEAQTPLPIALVRFIGLCEAAGALGLILPGALRIRPVLTPIAASCLVVLMICATILTPILIGDPVMMLLPAVTGALAAFVAYGRTRLAPQRSR